MKLLKKIFLTQLVLEILSNLNLKTKIKVLSIIFILEKLHRSSKSKNKHQLHLIAANIDLAVLVTTLKQPTFKPGFIDRF